MRPLGTVSTISTIAKRKLLQFDPLPPRPNETLNLGRVEWILVMNRVDTLAFMNERTWQLTPSLSETKAVVQSVVEIADTVPNRT